MGKKLNLDVIYVNYNSTDCLIASIESIFRFKSKNYHLNIIVVDNASTDGVLRIIHRFPEIHLTINPRNVGFGAAINQALKLCHSRYIILLNPDSLAFDGFLPTSIAYMETHPAVGIVGPMILDDGGGIQGSARSFPTPLTSLFGRNSPITRIYPDNSITRANILTFGSDRTTPMSVDWVSGACMVVRHDAIRQVGGFDKRFFLYWEDTDLCRRIKDAGWEIIYLPEATVMHIGGKSSNTRPVFSNFHFHKSCYRLYDKYAVWPYHLLTPIAGIALMLRFLIAVAINYLLSVMERLPDRKRASATGRQKRHGKIKVLRIISRMNIGGPSIHVKNLTENMNPNRFVTRLLTGSVSAGEGDMSYIANFGEDVRIEIPELQREISPYKDLIALIKVIKTINNFNPDIVHSHTSKAGTISRLAAAIYNLFQRERLITVHTFHGHVLDGYFSRSKSILILLFERLMAMVTDTIIAISTTQKWELSKKYKIASARKFATIGLGFNLFPFVNNGQYNGRLRQELGASEETLLIGIVGRMVPIKNHKMFLDAAEILLNRCASRKLKFILVGSGELKGDLETYSTKIGISDHTIFYGWEKNIPMIYADLDILALTSLNEGTPVSIIEAMAASVPVVTTGVGGIKDLLGKILTDPSLHYSFKICERGILCQKDDPEIFADALKYLVESDTLKNGCQLDKAREYVLKNYSVGRLLTEVESLYEKLVI